MGVNKMTGVPWHVEKAKKQANRNSRNCFNCVYLVDHYCKKNKIICTNNNARICKAFVNKYNDLKKVEQIEQEEQRKHNNETEKIKNSIKWNTIIHIKTKNDLFIKIKDKVEKNGYYCFRGFVENVNDSVDVDKFNYINIFLTYAGNPMRCVIKPNSVETIRSGKYLTVAFEINKIDYRQKYDKKNYISVLQGNDCFYGDVVFLQHK